jgi:hypothetical protein
MLLVRATQPAGKQGARPKVRRYRLARLQVDPLAAAPTSGFERPKSANG